MYEFDETYIYYTTAKYKALILVGDAGINSEDDNVDVEVRFPDGNRYTATFFTIKNLQSLFNKHKQTGENKSGLYWYTADMIIVEKLSKELIIEVIEHLISENSLKNAMIHINDSEEREWES